MLKSRSLFQRKLRSKRLTLDNCKCVNCGSVDNLECHHHYITIQEMVNDTLSQLGNINLETENNRLKVAELVQRREDYLNINNLRTVCKDCHIEIHTKDLIID